MTQRITRLFRNLFRDSAPAISRNAPPPRPHLAPHPQHASQTSPLGWGFKYTPSRKTVLSRGFASGAFAYSSVPTRNDAKGKKALVGSCAGAAVDTRELRKIAMMAVQGWRGVHTGKCSKCKGDLHEKEGKGEVPEKPPETAVVRAEKEETAVVAQGTVKDMDHHEEHGPEGWRSRIASIHRPTRDEMLAAATGFFERLRIITKWSMIRQMRPYTLDEIGAFFSWLVLGQILWILLGTTTFLSVLIYLANTVSAQEFLAKTIGNYLTKETGTRVVFESAIVPRWKDGMIQFKNVFISRRPGSHSRSVFQKGSAGVAAAAAQAAINADLSNPDKHEVDDGNYTQFDVTIDTVSVELSLARWMNGKGLLSACEIKGVRGVVDRTHVQWEPDVDPASYKREHAPGDFEILSFKLEDVLVTLYQPDNFRPFNISIFSADLPQLRKQWLFYDFLSANHMSGSYDDSLFTIHPRQGPTVFSSGDGDAPPSPWKKTNRLRIDGLSIDHLNRGVDGPFSWITNANVDLVCDITFPSDSNLDLSGLVSEIVSRVENTVSGDDSPPPSQTIGPQKYCHIAMSVNLNDVRAAVPLFPRELSYVNIALIRPIVAYLNSRRGAYIPVSFTVHKPLENFDGSWSIFDCGMMDDLSAATYTAFVDSVQDQQARKRRIKRVSLWTLQVIAQIIGLAMAGNLA